MSEETKVIITVLISGAAAGWAGYVIGWMKGYHEAGKKALTALDELISQDRGNQGS